MTWDRIEVMGRHVDLDDGVKARVADPYWMVGRQWQTGELQGDLGGQPVKIVMEAESFRLTSYRPRPDAEATSWGPGSVEKETDAPRAGRHPSAGIEGRHHAPVPFERMVEEIPVAAHGPARLRAAAELGEQIIALFRSAGHLDARDELREIGRLESDWDPGLGSPAAATRLLVRRGVDGFALLASDELWDLAGKVGGALASQLELLKAAMPAENPAWDPERFEYRGSLAAMTTDGEVTLQLADHWGGHLDWYQYDVGGDPHELDKRTVDDLEPGASAIPTPLTYVGQPAAGWWELEDGRVHLGDLQAGPNDFARLAVAEFAVSFSDDWFVVPLRLEVGTLSRVTSLTVVDSFGDTIGDDIDDWIRHVALMDGPVGPFRLFELAGDPSVGRGRAPWLFVPPALGPSIEGPGVERVSIVRDEAANLAWAIESHIEGPLGRSLERSRDWFARSGERAAESPSEHRYDDTTLVYSVETDIPPPWWIPLLAQRLDPSSADIRLRRGRMRAWEESADPVGALGWLLAPERPLAVHEEEVPRTGIEVERRWQHARWFDGSSHVWRQNRKRRGYQVNPSGVTWDRLSDDPDAGHG